MYQVLIKNGPKGDELEIHSPFSNDLKLIEGVIKKGINTFDSLICRLFLIIQHLEK